MLSPILIVYSALLTQRFEILNHFNKNRLKGAIYKYFPNSEANYGINENYSISSPENDEGNEN